MEKEIVITFIHKVQKHLVASEGRVVINYATILMDLVVWWNEGGGGGEGNWEGSHVRARVSVHLTQCVSVFAPVCTVTLFVIGLQEEGGRKGRGKNGGRG